MEALEYRLEVRVHCWLAIVPCSVCEKERLWLCSLHTEQVISVITVEERCKKKTAVEAERVWEQVRERESVNEWVIEYFCWVFDDATDRAPLPATCGPVRSYQRSMGRGNPTASEPGHLVKSHCYRALGSQSRNSVRSISGLSDPNSNNQELECSKDTECLYK